MTSIIQNQLINKLNYTVHNDDNVPIDITSKNIDTYYKEVYILLKRDHDIIPIDFYNLYVSEKLYKNVTSNLMIYKVSISIILKNISKFFHKLMIKSNTEIESFNIFNYTLNDKNLILPIFNIHYLDLSTYMNQYNITNDIDNIYKLILMNNYLEKQTHTGDTLFKLINNIHESTYWTCEKNCLINITEQFNKRRITFDIGRLNNTVVINNISKVLKSKILTNDEDYIKDINNKDKKYIDIASFSNYVIEDKPDMNHEIYNKLFDSLNEKEQYFLFTNSMISKKYVHLAINNKHIMDIMVPRMKPMACLFKYLLSYSWIMFYYEECIKKSSLIKTDTCIFDIDTASTLPVFPFFHTKMKENPYMPILVSDQKLLKDTNIGGIPEINNIMYRNNGICNLKEFIHRMNIFCINDENVDIFENFDFHKYNVAICGSIMTACLQKKHPLMNVIENCTFDKYFNEYYYESDIDVMFIAKNIKTFITNVNAFYKQICINMLKTNKKYNDVELILNKIGYLFVTKQFIDKNISKDPSKIKWIMNNINSDEVQEIFKPFYDKLKKEKYQELIQNYTEQEIKTLEEEYPDIYKTIGVKFKIYVNNHSAKEIDLAYTFKYNITSKYLKHSFELFKICSNDFFSHVSQFHLPCVRGYYDGNVYLTPSCISSHMTYMNIDYKYVTGSTDIIEIINKYRARGFGTILNKNEHTTVTNYCLNMPHLKKIFPTNASINGPIQFNHLLYRPRNELVNKYNLNLYLPSFYNSFSYMKILKAIDPLILVSSLYKNTCVINNDGCINPLKKWIIDYTWDFAQGLL